MRVVTDFVVLWRGESVSQWCVSGERLQGSREKERGEETGNEVEKA